jgi:Domain of unknown function(DUF2779)
MRSYIRTAEADRTKTIPFQWSLHHVDSRGAVTHQEFLGAAHSDPRRSFAETLLAGLRGTKLPVIVYSSYEKARLTELAVLFPDLAKPIRGLVRRLADLLPVVRGCVYHPNFDFSNSIKVTAPALCPDVTYDDLEEIADGNAASTAFWLMASGQADPEMSAVRPLVAGLLPSFVAEKAKVALSALKRGGIGVDFWVMSVWKPQIEGGVATKVAGGRQTRMAYRSDANDPTATLAVHCGIGFEGHIDPHYSMLLLQPRSQSAEAAYVEGQNVAIKYP